MLDRDILPKGSEMTPEGEISWSYIDRFIMDNFLPLFQPYLSEHKKAHKRGNFQLFTYWIYSNSKLTSVFIGYKNGGKQFAPC